MEHSVLILILLFAPCSLLYAPCSLLPALRPLLFHQPVGTGVFTRFHNHSQKLIIYRKSCLVIVRMPEVEAYGHEWVLFSLQAVTVKSNCEFRVFPSPSLKVLIESINSAYVLPKKTHVTAAHSTQPGGEIRREASKSYYVMTI